jgi:hypothetical protein
MYKIGDIVFLGNCSELGVVTSIDESNRSYQIYWIISKSYSNVAEKSIKFYTQRHNYSYGGSR